MSAMLAPSPVRIGVFDAAREGSRAPAKVGICEWAEREIRILKGSEKGRLRLARAPYMREMLEAFENPRVREITLKTASQVAKTTVMMICVAYAMDEDPDDALYVMPGEELAREISVDRIKPMFHASPSIRKQFTDVSEDQQAIRYRFLRGTLFFAWAKSPATLASRPVRYVFLDETGKYPTFSGKEADPMSLATERAKTFHNRKIVIASTPTVPKSIVSGRFALSDRRRYWVPCPHCNEKQLLVSQYLKWPPGARGADVEADNLAWYECCKCGARLTDRDKPYMLTHGEWRAENPGTTRHRGYHINTLYSPWTPWSEYAKEFLESHGRPEKFMNFVNSWEGEDWVEKAAEVTEASIAALKIAYETGVIPLGGLLLTCGIDVQKEYCRYIVRAWGVEDESWLVDYGTFLREKDGQNLWVEDKDFGVSTDLAKIARELLPTQYEHANGSRVPIHFAYIDSGFRTSEVYKLAARMRHVLHACKGANEVQIEGENAGKLQPRRLMPVEKIGGLHYTRLNTTYYKDMLQGMRENARKPWHIPDTVDETYLREVSAEHKRITRNSKGEAVHAWAMREGFTDNHYLDCEVYALAAADQKGFRKLTGEPQAPQRPRAGVRMPDGRAFSILNR